jgi:heat shock protein HtpX
LPAGAAWPAITEYVRSRGALGLPNNIGSVVGWFMLANAAVVLSLVIISGGCLIGFSPYVLAIGCLVPFIMLGLSKWLAQRVHRMERVIDGQFNSEGEGRLYRLVESLAARANLPKTPEVWIYASNDMNAFATGPSRGNAMVAFSSGLLANMDERGIASVAAHEISHVANNDMLILSLVQSVVNAIALLITIPLRIFKVIAIFSDEIGVLMYWIISICSWILTSIVFVLGNLVVLAFSRKREFAADALAAQLIDPDSMIHALQVLSTEVPLFPKEQKAYASFKINNAMGWTTIFSTHPTIEARVQRLVAMR